MKPGKVTWLTPYVDCWQAHAGTPPVARMARAMKPIEATVGPDRAVAALTAYLRAGHGRFGVEVFARDWRRWDAPTGLSDQERRSVAAITDFLAEESDHGL